MYMYIHTRIQVNGQIIYLYIDMYVYVYTYKNTYNTYVHIYRHTQTHARTHTYKHRCYTYVHIIYVCICTCIQEYTQYWRMQNNCTTSDRFKRFVFQRCRLLLVVNVKKKHTQCKFATLYGYETVAQ